MMSLINSFLTLVTLNFVTDVVVSLDYYRAAVSIQRVPQKNLSWYSVRIF